MVYSQEASGQLIERERLLGKLANTVSGAALFLAEADESLNDGHQTAREVLSHILFWHREYVAIVQALLEGHPPDLRHGTFAALNAPARLGGGLPHQARRPSKAGCRPAGGY